MGQHLAWVISWRNPLRQLGGRSTEISGFSHAEDGCSLHADVSFYCGNIVVVVHLCRTTSGGTNVRF